MLSFIRGGKFVQVLGLISDGEEGEGQMGWEEPGGGRGKGRFRGNEKMVKGKLRKVELC